MSLRWMARSPLITDPDLNFANCKDLYGVGLRETASQPIACVKSAAAVEAGRKTKKIATGCQLSAEWLGRRDSNPNNRVQSAVSYR
jgi:hypothetical protein